MLSIYDLCNKDGCVSKYISLAQAAPSSSSVDNNTDIISDSGGTSTMRRRCSDFEDDYKACTNVFVLIGDASRITVAGYGTSCMKIDGNVTRLVNSLHFSFFG